METETMYFPPLPSREERGRGRNDTLEDPFLHVPRSFGHGSLTIRLRSSDRCRPHLSTTVSLVPQGRRSKSISFAPRRVTGRRGERLSRGLRGGLISVDGEIRSDEEGVLATVAPSTPPPSDSRDRPCRSLLPGPTPSARVRNDRGGDSVH